MKSHYDILALPQNATREQIQARFRELVRQRHPDRFQGAEKERAEIEFQEITAAFNILHDPERRRLHDIELSRPTEMKPADDRGELIKVYLQRGIRAYKEQKYSEAADNFDRATKMDPANARAWYNLALACSHVERWAAKARSAAAKACDLDKMNARYLKTAGKLFDRTGMEGRAEHYYAESLKWGGADREVEQRLATMRKRGKGLFG